ncbi:MAG: hypothetical protein UE295_04085 [Acutalibacteraceae bacterium]|nr:hypothetical protein [Acutalibacteraceae bacterium]
MKSKILKIIFILSFIPYIFTVCGVIFSIFGDGIVTKQLLRLLEDIFESFLVIPIIPACLTFQMCYIFRNKRKAMFICSFIPCAFALLVILKYMFFGINILGDTMYYGLDALSVGLFGIFIYYVVFFPILPICLILQIVLIIKNKNQLQNN